MTTRSKARIFKPVHRPDFVHPQHHSLNAALFAKTDPTSFKVAAKQREWVMAMRKEIGALHQNKTWTFVPRPANTNIVGSKWIFRTKYLLDGTIERHKARLVAQGFTQVPGLDYSQTFSSVVKAATIRIVLSLAVINGWKLHQLDVNNAFLHGALQEKVYMEQPSGFIDPRFPHHVCRLNKALYGLKQAPRAWFQRLSTFLLQNGFSYSRADPSLFIFKQDSCIIYLLSIYWHMWTI
ncbi:putative RNA-directed DNA polymerase [Helianthus annuus]|nr:putative RNA-directed DNA polymerase [Helianthus annuus]KAJ0596773.1 putative RNA-directed DNA polymerase [Helianthus annuus]KAJ0757453.1 putative RNA-directed DNA polymerase [Helianthus annuus]KAJ0926573.1 putative RNA-directed DNA polymerase [Helianthus annuus]